MSEPSGRVVPTSTVVRPADFDAGFYDHPGYSSALNHLYGRLNTESLDPATFARVERNLDSYRGFLERLGNPHLGRPTVHITGTRGKGSTLAMLESILLAAGIRTGATVSPHLMEVRERIRIGGDDITRDDFARIYEILRPVADESMTGINYRTVFELLTALAFLSFRELNVDADVVEVGMGGKLDATNVVEPVLSIVTRIGLDHTQILGDTIEEIAADKSHIIKPGAGAVISKQKQEALSVLEMRCREARVLPWRLDHEIQLIEFENRLDGTSISLRTPHRTHNGLLTPLLGAHQAENATVAVAAADRLNADGIFDIPSEAIRAGLAKTRWPGRAEMLGRDPFVLIDGAHTDQGASALNDVLKDLFAAKPLILILGMNRDKDVLKFLRCFQTPPALVLATRAESPRSMDPDELAAIVENHGWQVQTVDLEDAWNVALEKATTDSVILATGSFYVIGALRRIWLQEQN